MRGGHERERNPGIAGGRLDEHAFSRLDLAGMLQSVDHGDADPVFHARERVEKFQLRQQMSADAIEARELFEAHKRGISDGVYDGSVNAPSSRSAVGGYVTIVNHAGLRFLPKSIIRKLSACVS